MQVSVDGFVAAPDGGQGWMAGNWGSDIDSCVDSLTASVDCILLGRKLAEGFTAAWKARLDEAPEDATAKWMHGTQKIVFSRDESRNGQPFGECNARVCSSDTLAEVQRLKSSSGGDLIVYGGATFVADLIKHDLIDEYYLFVNPTALGKGLSIFTELESPKAFKLHESRAFDCGVVLLNYKRSC